MKECNNVVKTMSGTGNLVKKQFFVVLLLLSLSAFLSCIENPSTTSAVWNNIVNTEWSNFDDWAGTGLYFYEENNTYYCVYLIYGSGMPIIYSYKSILVIENEKMIIHLPINLETGMCFNNLDEIQVEKVTLEYEDNTIKFGGKRFQMSEIELYKVKMKND